MADQGVECTDVAEALVVPLGERNGNYRTVPHERKHALPQAVRQLVREATRSPGMLCNVIGETQAPRRLFPASRGD